MSLVILAIRLTLSFHCSPHTISTTHLLVFLRRYIPLAQALQATAPLRLWIGIPDFPLSTLEPLVIAGRVQRVLAALQEKNMSKDVPLFVGGHSLGGIIIQVSLGGGVYCTYSMLGVSLKIRCVI